MVKRALLIGVLCLLLSVSARAQNPETIVNRQAELPAQVQTLLPDDVEFQYANPLANMIYMWTKNLGGNGAALVFRESDGAYALLLRSAPFQPRQGLAPMLDYSGKAFYTVKYSDSFSFSFRPGADGRWMLGAAFLYGKDECFISFYPHAAVEFRPGRVGMRRIYGTWTQSLFADAPDAASEIIGAVGGDAAENPDTVGELTMIGIVNGTWYHVTNLWGQHGYIECKWFFEGFG